MSVFGTAKLPAILSYLGNCGFRRKDSLRSLRRLHRNEVNPWFPPGAIELERRCFNACRRSIRDRKEAMGRSG